MCNRRKKGQPFGCPFFRASHGTRTHDLLITNELLYQLSYRGVYYKTVAKIANFSQKTTKMHVFAVHFCKLPNIQGDKFRIKITFAAN